MVKKLGNIRHLFLFVGGATHKRIPPINFLAHYQFTRPSTQTHVRLFGSCFKTGQMRSPHADARNAQTSRQAESMSRQSVNYGFGH